VKSKDFLESAEYNEGFDFPEILNEETTNKLAKSYHDVLTNLGEDPNREKE